MKIRILGVPLDLGQERRGVDMGPSAVRAAGLNHALKNLGHLDVMNKTAILGVGLVSSALGKKIL